MWQQVAGQHRSQTKPAASALGNAATEQLHSSFPHSNARRHPAAATLHSVLSARSAHPPSVPQPVPQLLRMIQYGVGPVKS